MPSRWKVSCVAVVLFSGIFALTIAAKAACTAGCNTGDCWKVNGTCWKAPQITCCDFGSQATQVGGTKNKTGTVIALKNSSCTAECPMAADSRASCSGTNGTDQWEIDKCTCDS